MIKQTKWRTLTAVGISPTFWVQTRQIKIIYIDMNSHEKVLSERQVAQYRRHKFNWQVKYQARSSIDNRLMRIDICWQLSKSIASLSWKLTTHITSYHVRLAVYHTTPTFNKCMSTYTALKALSHLEHTRSPVKLCSKTRICNISKNNTQALKPILHQNCPCSVI